MEHVCPPVDAFLHSIFTPVLVEGRKGERCQPVSAGPKAIIKTI